MKDLISRQAAIDAVYKCTDIYINNLPVMVDKADVYKALAELPSAQPEIIRCKDCKWFGEKPCLMNWFGHDWAEPDGYCHMAERRIDG